MERQRHPIHTAVTLMVLLAVTMLIATAITASAQQPNERIAQFKEEIQRDISGLQRMLESAELSAGVQGIQAKLEAEMRSGRKPPHPSPNLSAADVEEFRRLLNTRKAMVLALEGFTAQRLDRLKTGCFTHLGG